MCLAVEKQQVCCEYIGESARRTRDRLEIRVRRGDPLTAFAALKRDQFASGYDAELDSQALHLIHSYFGDQFLLQAHTELNKIANDLLRFICQFIEYKAHERLSRRLSKEKDTPGVLRLMRYVKHFPSEAEKDKVVELAVDHTDIGLITIMPHADSESLQILSNDYQWIDIERNQGADTIVAIVGEQLAYLSNYTFQAVRHRVIETPTHATRYSLPFLMRAPAEFELVQAKTGQRRLARDVLNHIFELPVSVQRRYQTALHLVDQYSVASDPSKRSTRLVAAAAAFHAQSAISDAIWPLFLFFDHGLPSSSTHKRFRSNDNLTCTDTQPLQLLEDRCWSPQLYAQFEGKGWNPTQWPDGIEFFECSLPKTTDETNTKPTDVERWIIFLVPLGFLEVTPSEEAKSSSDFDWTLRCSSVLKGRGWLEAAFDLNRYRLH